MTLPEVNATCKPHDNTKPTPKPALLQWKGNSNAKKKPTIVQPKGNYIYTHTHIYTGVCARVCIYFEFSLAFLGQVEQISIKCM